MPKGKRPKHWAKFRFEIVRKKTGRQKYFWRLIACNGKTVCVSETMHIALAPVKTIASVVSAIQNGEFKITETEEE